MKKTKALLVLALSFSAGASDFASNASDPYQDQVTSYFKDNAEQFVHACSSILEEDDKEEGTFSSLVQELLNNTLFAEITTSNKNKENYSPQDSIPEEVLRIASFLTSFRDENQERKDFLAKIFLNHASASFKNRNRVFVPISNPGQLTSQSPL